MIIHNPMSGIPSDAQLVGDSLAGDREAFGQIVARYQSLICSLAYCSTGSLNQSEDLAQETFVTAWKELAALREPAKLRSWLCGIVRNTARNSQRRQGRQPAHEADTLETSEFVSPEPAPADQAIKREEEAMLWRAVERIPEAYREPLVLFYREHQSVARVAEALDLNEEAVKQRLSRGRKMLQEEIAGFVEGTLARTVPSRAFTASVLTQLPAASAAVKAGTAAGAVAKAGVAGKALGLLAAVGSVFLVLAGNYFGYRSGMESAQSKDERTHIKRFYLILFVGIVLFNVAFGTLIFWATNGGTNRPQLLISLILTLAGAMILFMAWLTVGSYRSSQRLRALRSVSSGAETTPAAWEYRSRATFLGLPLVHIRISGKNASERKPVVAWIAAGNVAYGGLFAFAGMAVAPVSIGGLAIGLLPFGGCAAGLLPLGAVALGWFANGGLAAGWNAFGACAVAWNGAQAECAVAWNYAAGNIGGAAQFNTDAALAFFHDNWFFRTANAAQPYEGWLNLLWVLPMALWWQLQRRAARARAAGSAALAIIILMTWPSAGRAQTNVPPDATNTVVEERFADLVRDDMFSGDPQRIQHAIKVCEDDLAQHPKHAAALAWHGDGLIYQSSAAFQKGDIEKGTGLWRMGIQEMNDAVALTPDSLHVVIPRGATFLSIAKYSPDPEEQKKLLRTGVGDYEKAFRLQAGYFNTLDTHSRGELLFGLADGYYRLGDTNRMRQYLSQIVTNCAGTAYASRADEWLGSKDAAALKEKSAALSCIGCHAK